MQQELVITRQEAFALTNVLGRIPREIFSLTEMDESTNITLNMIEDPPPSLQVKVPHESSILRMLSQVKTIPTPL